MKKNRKLLISAASIVLIIAGLFLFTNIYLVLLPPLDVGAQLDEQYGTVILVLGGGLKKGRELGYSTEERLKLAVELFKKKKRKIIVSGGSLYKRSPAIKKIRLFFKSNGVDEKYLSFEGKSQTTFDHFLYTQKMIAAMKTKEVIISTSPYHQCRAGMILSYLHLNNFKISRMNESEIYQANSISQRLRNIKLIFREYLAIVKFKILKK
ncbi:MAG: YdcF family protein [bacterium]|nr:YdcF family protein [bacterium]